MLSNVACLLESSKLCSGPDYPGGGGCSICCGRFFSNVQWMSLANGCFWMCLKICFSRETCDYSRDF